MKNSKLNCIIGDVVEFDEDEKVITKIFERKNYLHRPLLSNIDFIGILFAIENPKFDFINFQKMLLNSNYQNIPCILILSKFLKIFGNTVRVFPISIKGNFGIKELKDYIKRKSIVISGPSGAGKSSLINSLMGEELLATSDVSQKTKKGRHTTTESRFFMTDEHSYIIDTPGFSTLDFPRLKSKKELELLFPEFLEFLKNCKFRDCIHTNEPNCAIKENVQNHKIHKKRYDFYLYSLKNIKIK